MRTLSTVSFLSRRDALRLVDESPPPSVERDRQPPRDAEAAEAEVAAAEGLRPAEEAAEKEPSARAPDLARLRARAAAEDKRPRDDVMVAMALVFFLVPNVLPHPR